MNETTKCEARRRAEGFYDRYLIGHGIDIGCGADPITRDCIAYDQEQGDAQTLEGIGDDSCDWVYSSHCLEHVRDPLEALLNWWRVLKPGGYLCVAGPDEDLYEQGIIPSVFNPDHKWTYTIHKDKSWSPRSRNIVDLVRYLPDHRVVYFRTMDTNYDYSLTKDGQVCDQTMKNAEAAVEFVVQKSPEQPSLKSQLQLIGCPKCEKLRLELNGFAADRTLQCLCRNCGWFGGFRLQPLMGAE